jgi:FAD/FMN-containing dehydrogenase
MTRDMATGRRGPVGEPARRELQRFAHLAAMSAETRRRTTQMSAPTTANDVDTLRHRLAGTVLVDGQDGYDDARTLFNATIDRRPAVIARCVSPADVAEAIAFGRAHELAITVRSGGHGVAGTALSDGGLVIDTRLMHEVLVDPVARTARVGGGANWGMVDRACQPHGLMTTGGRVTTTGVAGLTLGGGDGWLARGFGLACDNLLAVELVTADGRTVTASEDEHAELFWALHGGGGNFGVATSLTFRLHELPVTTFAILVYDPEDGEELVRRYRDLIETDAPDTFGGGLLYLTGPEESFVPARLVGTLTPAVIVVHAGPEPEARRVMAPLLDLGPAGELIEELPYAEVQGALDDPPGYRNYWTAEHLARLPDEAVAAYCRRASDMVVPSPSQHALLPWGGAIAAEAGRWPIANRDATWCVHPLGLWEDPADDERAIAWARAVRADLAPYAAGGTYLNYTTDEGRDRTIAGYGGAENYRRLAAVKAEYDPDNTFRFNHNIQPVAHGG